MEGINDASYRRWKGAEWWTEDFDGLWNAPPVTSESTKDGPTIERATDEPLVIDNDAALPTVKGNAEPTLLLDTPKPEAKPSEPSTTDTPTLAPSSRLKSRRGQRQAAPQVRASCSQESVVYLTADAEDELLELKEGETYIIGGIVDRNRYKASQSSQHTFSCN